MTDLKGKYNGIIIFGEMSSGKDTLADLLIKNDKRCCKYNISYIIRKFFSIIKVNPHFRGNSRELGQVLADRLREVHPQILNDYCLSKIYEKWESKFNWDNSTVDEADLDSVILQQLSHIKEFEIPIIVGGRTFDDFNYWTGKNFLTVGLIVDSNVKVDRLISRDGAEVAQNSNFKHNTEIDVSTIARTKCDVIVNNSFTLDHLEAEAKKLLAMF